VIGNAIMVAKIATGEIKENREARESAALLGRRGGKKRAANLSEERRSEIAKKAAKTRWAKKAARGKAAST
jgi:hypothetical protein